MKAKRSWLLIIPLLAIIASEPAYAEFFKHPNAPLGFMTFNRMDGNDKHAAYSYCVGIMSGFEAAAKEDNEAELEMQAAAHYEYFVDKALDLRGQMYSARLFSSRIDLMTFDMVSQLVYNRARDHVIEDGPNNSIPDLEHCIELVAQDFEGE